MTWIKDKLIAHRGLYSADGNVPENSMLAIKNAIDSDYGIEFDINVLGDGNVVVFHDNNLKRLCGVDKDLIYLKYEDIKDLTLLKSSEKIPLLKDVLEFIDGRVPLLIELKPKGDNRKLFNSFIKLIDNYKGVYAVHSFNPRVIYWFKKYRPNIIRGQISEFFRDDSKMSKILKYLMKTMLFNFITKPDFINYGIKDLPNKYLDKLHKKGIVIISYASRSQEEFDMVKKYYDNSVFEFFIPKKKPLNNR